ncbi:hypothetical protein HCN51_03035 [Nonomuraea sp. FMUSA5-5]|uniref:Uncharacterized protein n=1 Tax=Nonomuraea composti TaxID=2720023 RepID=A0ABX1AYH4_9ACTN|nr:hypothetical protein [Nonomuraea sp. FMUSA5-5]NJP88444.1 hypothetical protein [Nonomuraea sp. FMUSA5-5]
MRGMCHHIEDGTFDWTAQAVNPRARIRPVHRPPRVPGDRVPHCRWEVVIDDDTGPVGEAPITAMTRGTTAARFRFPRCVTARPTCRGRIASPAGDEFRPREWSSWRHEWMRSGRGGPVQRGVRE